MMILFNKNSYHWFAAAMLLASPILSASNEGVALHDCLIEPMVVANIGSPVQGILSELLVDRSDTVKAGQAIAKLHSTVEQANLEHAQARAAMQSEISAREADLALAKDNLRRQQALYKQELVPEKDKGEAVARERVAKAALVQAFESAQLLQIEMMRAEHLLEQRTLRSPFDGVVVEQHTFAGEFVYDNTVLTLAQLDPLRIEVVLPARLFGQFKSGDRARISPEIPSDEPLIAVVDVVDRLLDTRSGTFGVRLLLSNQNFNIAGGQKCQLEFQSELASND